MKKFILSKKAIYNAKVKDKVFVLIRFFVVMSNVTLREKCQYSEFF